jgi:hypothetical protein
MSQENILCNIKCDLLAPENRQRLDCREHGDVCAIAQAVMLLKDAETEPLEEWRLIRCKHSVAADLHNQ